MPVITPEQINKAIAIHRGWHWREGRWIDPDRNTEDDGPCPDYVRDLNICYDILKEFTADELALYRRHLSHFMGQAEFACSEVLRAGSLVVATCIYRTLGLSVAPMSKPEILDSLRYVDLTVTDWDYLWFQEVRPNIPGYWQGYIQANIERLGDSLSPRSPDFRDELLALLTKLNFTEEPS